MAGWTTKPVLFAAIAIALVAVLVGCTRQSDVAEPPTISESGPSHGATPDDPDALVDDATPEDDETLDELSAAAGLPQPMRQPLVPELEIEFEYGTLIEYTPDPTSGLRALTIEPIGLPLADAIRSLDASLQRAGFKLDPANGMDEQARIYRKQDANGGLELQIAGLDYALPELAAHPGGSGTLALTLQRRPEGR